MLFAPMLRLRRVRSALARQARFTEDPDPGQDGGDPRDGSPR